VTGDARAPFNVETQAGDTESERKLIIRGAALRVSGPDFRAALLQQLPLATGGARAKSRSRSPPHHAGHVPLRTGPQTPTTGYDDHSADDDGGGGDQEGRGGLTVVWVVTFSSWQAADKLLAAATAGDLGGVRALLEGPDEVPVNTARDDKGRTALVLAAQQGHCELVKLLLDLGAHIHGRDDTGTTALIWAADAGHCEVVQLLLGRGAYVHSRDDTGVTALMKAVSSAHRETANLLLNHGARVNARNNDGVTALMIAAQKGAVRCWSCCLIAGQTSVPRVPRTGTAGRCSR
jgi:hypothetical protein